MWTRPMNPMAVVTECAKIRRLIFQFWVRLDGLDVVYFQTIEVLEFPLIGGDI